ncbi:esterase [Photobacterium aquimaris]|uniref:Alpha/beta hydrolase n=1 Tax=Photobacterium aquimaris TaxID=512643 RepID=A0A2T3IN47_9GAMM|nr:MULTISPECIES: alpha/beta fold hydrolase [Photobacterium]OBU14884.1 esterase [Photobacterium aquimaris]OBU18679.1 esterase [Photobacterium aquimaris]PSU29768.1 alpha/beta hydrolase [Photobacterium aquimaris]PSW02973.1 alpha/beta hydrolase [Photobacterium aquimaris]
MNLHFRAEGKGKTIVLIHGLFGSADNLGLLARELKHHYQVISVDLRNHGLSPHSDQFNYADLAQDIIETLDHLAIDQFDVIGHSMGGKVAMTLAALMPARINHLIVIDIAPVAYTEHRHQNVFNGLREVNLHSIAKRSQAEDYLARYVDDAGVRQFLLKSLTKTDTGYQWRFNVEGLIANYATIMGWQPAPQPFNGQTLFIKGQLSDYIEPQYRSEIMAQFPHAKAHVVANSGHWLHAEKPTTVNRIIDQFLAQ